MNNNKVLVFLIIFIIPASLIFSLNKEDEAQVFFERGIQNLKESRFIKAIQDFSRAIELNPTFAKAYNNRGLARYNLQDHPAAIQDFTRAVEIDPEYTDAFYNRGIAKFYFNDHSGAVQDFNQVIASEPEDGNAYYMRGLSKTYIEGMDMNSVCEDFRKAKELGNKQADDAIIKYCSEEE